MKARYTLKTCKGREKCVENGCTGIFTGPVPLELLGCFEPLSEMPHKAGPERFAVNRSGHDIPSITPPHSPVQDGKAIDNPKPEGARFAASSSDGKADGDGGKWRNRK